jgi:beta-N-acetylhexosaminidase
VDLSFAPVLDLDHGPSGVIGDRAFHRDPAAVATLAQSLIDGLAEAGMSSVGKHFPGHGFVAADSHLALPVDNRSYATLAADDLVPFQKLIAVLGGVMPAHIVFDQVDARRTAGFSPSWLQVVLRQRLGFLGAVFSDDLSMEGASVAGDVVGRASAAVQAGCDMVLVCNAAEAARDLLARWRPVLDENSPRRIERLVPTEPGLDFPSLRRRDAYIAAQRAIAAVPVLVAGERAARG